MPIWNSCCKARTVIWFSVTSFSSFSSLLWENIICFPGFPAHFLKMDFPVFAAISAYSAWVDPLHKGYRVETYCERLSPIKLRNSSITWDQVANEKTYISTHILFFLMIITEKSWYSNVSEDMEYKYHKKLFNSFFIQFIFYFLICECIYILKEGSVFLS